MSKHLKDNSTLTGGDETEPLLRPKDSHKYALGGDEAEYEPDSDQQVLKNLLGITEPEMMFALENELLDKMYQHLFIPDFKVEHVSFQTLQEWHQLWLGSVYPWAGKVRTVNMSKGGFHFAAANRIASQLPKLEHDYLSRFAEVAQLDDNSLVELLAGLHVEFILIHPFREGNGRIARLLLDAFAVRAGFQPLDYSLWNEHKDFYFKSIQAGVAGDYSHMQRLVRDVLFESQ